LGGGGRGTFGFTLGVGRRVGLRRGVGDALAVALGPGVGLAAAKPSAISAGASACGAGPPDGEPAQATTAVANIATKTHCTRKAP